MRVPKPLIHTMVALAAAVTGLVVMSSSAPVGIGPTTLYAADAIKCDLSQYRGSQGLTAAIDQDVLTVSWNGQGVDGEEENRRCAK